MTTERKIGLNGALVFWSLGDWGSKGDLTVAFAEADFFVRFRERTETSRLKSALAATFPEAMIRKVKGEGQGAEKLKGYEVLNEHLGPTRNSYSHVVTVLIGEDMLMTADGESFPGSSYTTVWSSHVESNPDDAFSRLYAAYLQERNRVHCSAVSDALVRAVEVELQGQSVRPKGGLYWVAEANLDRLDPLAVALRKPACGMHDIYVVRHTNDESAVRAVLKSFSESTQRQIVDLRDRIRDTRNDARTVASQQRAVEALHERIVAYEGFLSTELTGLHEKLSGVEEDLIETKLAASVA